jgi:hypothetical protein
MDGLAMVVLTIPGGIKTGCSRRHAEIFPFPSFIGGRHLVFREDRLVWALWDTSAAVNAGVRIDVVPRPLFNRLTWYDTFHRTDIHAT